MAAAVGTVEESTEDTVQVDEAVTFPGVTIPPVQAADQAEAGRWGKTKLHNIGIVRLPHSAVLLFLL